ncbi:MAG: hypothetical protein NTX44_13625 [Ignavibacteriales bacterium]|nr:hypothetical protein [Ignavibacteriales bacterium]
MKQKIAVITSACLLILFYFEGCERSSTMATQPDQIRPVAQQDQSAMGSIIAQDPLFTTDAAALNDADPSLAKTDAAIVPNGWGRKIQTSSRTVTYNHVNDSTVIATVTNTLTGQVWIRVKQTPKDTIIFKPLAETLVHKVEFMRVPLRKFSQLSNWKIVAVSGTQGGTSTMGISIQNVTLFSGQDTVQIMNPLDSLFQIPFASMHQHWGLREWNANPAGIFKIVVTVKSTDPDSDVVTAHRPLWFEFADRFMRAQMSLVSSVANGDGTFTRVYENNWNGSFAGRFNVFVSVLTRQSIYDNQAQFASQVWGIPFIIQ